MGAKIELHSVTKSFVGKKTSLQVLEDLSFAVEPGEFLCLLGPSGCGKSTILNLFAGFEHCDSGRCSIDDEAIDRPNPDRAMVFQEHAVFPWLSCLKNVEFGLRCQGMDRTKRRELAGEALAQFQLAEFAHYYPRQLSGGMKQRLALARTFVLKPKVLLLDEPFSGLDHFTRYHLQEELRRLHIENKTTTLFVTHSIEEAAFLADRILLLSGLPASIIADIPNCLRRRRQDSDNLRSSGEFFDIQRKIHCLLKKGTLPFSPGKTAVGA